MLTYDPDVCAFWHMLQIEGSVLPRTLAVAVPATLVTIAFHMTSASLGYALPTVEAGQAWVGYNAALGALIVFRTQQAYSRWWEGGALLQQVRGEWYNAASSLIAFTTRKSEYKKQAVNFQHLIVRLMSMLYCSALQQVAEIPHEEFEILDTAGIEEASINYLTDSDDRCEVLVQWIQRLTVKNMEEGILAVPAPVVSRVFQELGRGMVNFNNVKKIKEFPFPFPYLQILELLLLLQATASPIANCFLVTNVYFASALTFFSVAGYWSINYIAHEIEHPFGTDANDLPVIDMCSNMNRSLWILLEKHAQRPPSFTFIPERHTSRCSSAAIAMRGPHRLGRDDTFVGHEEDYMIGKHDSKDGAETTKRGVVLQRGYSAGSLSINSMKSSATALQEDKDRDKDRQTRKTMFARSSSKGSLLSVMRPQASVATRQRHSTRQRRISLASARNKFQDRSAAFVGDGQSDDEEPKPNHEHASGEQRLPVDETSGSTKKEGTLRTIQAMATAQVSRTRCPLTNGYAGEEAAATTPLTAKAATSNGAPNGNGAGVSLSTYSAAFALEVRSGNPENPNAQDLMASRTSLLVPAQPPDCSDKYAPSTPHDMRPDKDLRTDGDKLPDHTSVVLTLR
eukprot:TRINITY_DN8612_c0_g1_i3.p1 TRINITY_DN8612_c0_g1~~TRINITY_DN8612_c0_g1_i3.p1  ORF type:complete len:655 (-),score=86.96 TRINITY_DN8612_c0_g1_i3:152-2026(-)